MTTAPAYLNHGYSSFSGFDVGSLTTDTFEIDDVTYTVKVIEAWGWFYIGFDREVPIAFTLDVDNTLLNSSDASLESYSYAQIYRWQGTGIDWGNGETVELAMYAAGS